MTIAGESSVAYPPRFWWLKRLSLLGVVIVGGLGVLRAWWGHHAGQLLAAERDRIRAAGEPLEPEELNPPPLAPERNAATYLNQAIGIKSLSRVYSPSSSDLEYRDSPPYPRKWHKLADDAVAANGGVFPPLRKAREFDEADWGARYASGAAIFPPPGLNATRELANFGTDAAAREHVRGNDAAALELIRDVRHLGVIRAQDPVVISYLVGIGIEALALSRLKAIAPGLDVIAGGDGASGGAVPGGPATRGQVDALIAELLRDPHGGMRLVSAMQGERVIGTEFVRAMTRRNWLLRPMFLLEERRVMLHYARYLTATTRPTFAGAKAAMPGPPSDAERRRISRSISTHVMPTFQAITLQDMRISTERRFTAVALAARLYQLDHDGAWPPSLDALVPKYLPAVPADPFDPAGGPLRYVIIKGGLPLGGDRPIVYSLADNGTDETSNGKMPLDPGPQTSWYHGDDQRRDLARWMPLPDLRGVASAIFRLPEAKEDDGDVDGDGIPDLPVPDEIDSPPATAPAAATAPSSQAVDDQPGEADEPGDDE